MLFITLGFVLFAFVLLAVIIAFVTILCFSAATCLVIGFALRTSRFAWLSPFLMWIPSLAAAFAVTFFSYTALSFRYGFPLPDSFTGYLIAFLLGELSSIAAGTALALRTHYTKSDQPKKLTTKPPLNVES